MALILAAASLLSACGSGGEDSSDELEQTYAPGQVVKETSAEDSIFSINYDSAAGINPITAESANNMQFWSLMYDSLYIVNSDFTVRSEVVLEANTADYQWWTFTIDNSICFHDGSPLTAKDVVYSINRARQHEYYAQRFTDLYGISALNDNQLAISLNRPNSQLPALLNIPIIKADTLFEELPPGTGPYKMAESGDKLVVNEYNRHASELPLDIIYLKDYMDTAAKISAYEASLIDIVTNDPTGMYNLGYGSSNETRYTETTNMHYIGFNFQSRYFSNYMARYAVGAAVDRNGIVADYMGNCAIPTTLPIHPISPLYDEAYAEGYAYDLSKSEALFQNYGVKDYDADGVLEIMVTGIVVEIDIKFIVNTDSTVKLQAARRIAETLNEMGIKVTLYEMKWEDYIEALEDGDYDMYYGEVRMTPDWDLTYLFKPYEVMRDPELTQKGMNYANCFDEQYGTLYGEYLAAGEESRNQAFSAICRYITESSAIIPVCFERQEILTHRGVITGIDATQYDIFNKFYDWTVNLK